MISFPATDDAPCCVNYNKSSGSMYCCGDRSTTRKGDDHRPPPNVHVKLNSDRTHRRGFIIRTLVSFLSGIVSEDHHCRSVFMCMRARGRQRLRTD